MSLRSYKIGATVAGILMASFAHAQTSTLYFPAATTSDFSFPRGWTDNLKGILDIKNKALQFLNGSEQAVSSITTGVSTTISDITTAKRNTETFVQFLMHVKERFDSFLAWLKAYLPKF